MSASQERGEVVIVPGEIAAAHGIADKGLLLGGELIADGRGKFGCARSIGHIRHSVQWIIRKLFKMATGVFYAEGGRRGVVVPEQMSNDSI